MHPEPAVGSRRRDTASRPPFRLTSSKPFFAVTRALSSASDVLARAETVVVHLLDAHDIEVAKLGATGGIDRFAEKDRWSRLVTGEPVYRDVRAWVRCTVIDRMDAGTSTVIAAHALQSHIERDIHPGGPGDALVYHNRTWHRLG